MHILISCVVFVIVTDRNAEAGQRCFECHDVPTPQSCTHVTECGEHEDCFTESVITSSGLLLYNVGCMSKLKCTASKRASHFAKRDVLTACLECCSKGDFCNMDGCGFNAVPREKRGPYCYHCNVQEDQHSCQDVIVCGQDQVCFLEPILDRLPNINYKSRCGEKLTCLAAQQTHNNGNLSHNVDEIFVGRRYAPFGDCPACCHIDFCNNDCNQNNSVSTIHGIEAPVTSTLITTSFTITSAPVTTLITTKPTSTATHSELMQATQLVTHVHQKHASTHMPKTTNVVLGTQHTSSCESHDRFHQLENNLGCVLFVQNHMDWNTANNYCRGNKSHLVNIESEEKQVAIFRFMKTHNENAYIWIGLQSTSTTPHNQHDWRWQAGLPYSYMHWDLNQPEGTGNCVVMYRNGYWRSVHCSTGHSFVCEKY